MSKARPGEAIRSLRRAGNLALDRVSSSPTWVNWTGAEVKMLERRRRSGGEDADENGGALGRKEGYTNDNDVPLCGAGNRPLTSDKV